MTFIGIDNGVSGSIGIISTDEEEDTYFVKTPVLEPQQNYTKKKGNVTRINYSRLRSFLKNFPGAHVMMERPLVNPALFKATTSALRAMEATLIAVESLKLSKVWVDSKEWQKKLLPSGIKGSTELKKASLDIGIRMFPQHEAMIRKQKDADGILMAHYYLLKYTGHQ